MGKLNPLNKVDLTNPELSIIIEIIKSVCCVSVLKDYMLFRKYNLQEVANQNTGPQEAANQNTGLQEAVNQNTAQQEAANQTQEHGEGEKADGSAESCDITAGNGTKEAELE